MRVVIRIIIGLLVLMMVLISGFALLCALGFISESQFGMLTYSFYDNLGTRAIVALACVFVILISVTVMLFRPQKRSGKSAKILTSRNGAIRISYRALSEMIVNAVKENSGISSARTRISGRDDGIDVLVIINVLGGQSPVKITQDIEKDIAEMLTERCGVRVEGVEVLVDRIIKKS